MIDELLAFSITYKISTAGISRTQKVVGAQVSVENNPNSFDVLQQKWLESS
jgi:hypothetical protein